MIIARDPGASGGWAWYGENGIGCRPTLETHGDTVDFIRELTANNKNPLTAYVEEVGGFVGGEGQPGSRMFTFGFGCGFDIGILMAFGWRVIMVRPQKWQSFFSIGKSSGCSSKSEWKRKLRDEAQRRFPNQRVTLKTADALLILDYAKVKEITE